MGKQSTLIIQKNHGGLLDIEYDYKLLMALLREAPKNSELYRMLNKVQYDAEQRRNINLELELRRAVMAHYFS